ncbi:winged helix DNA-binding domain-containing protein [Sinosporangium siamense]|uniref:Winged helix DNA-binding domain-containing protein n=1 Tax=Sinosporangium siamense TaxID=1367973 RepID=A0A919RFB9_9ACTN|nr:winged helix DNA-binding domain-containing protein [Sinosporangium siamense]GII92856.1 hypothetical protein Ssi02_30870 [Sinosporangium siamense]
MIKLTWDNVLAWRAGRQLLGAGGGVEEIVHRLCGVQAQVASSAATAVAVRRAAPEPGEVERALAERRLVKTWAMRGTLHLLTVEDAGAFLSLLASGRTWEKGSWQRTFVTLTQLEAIAEAVAHALDSRVLTREELVAEVLDRTGDPGLAEHLRSGWGSVLKPLAFQGLLCHGPSRANGDSTGGRVTFTRPDTFLPGWKGLPAPEEAAAVAVPAYLGAYGPAPIEAFDQWLLRGTLRKPALRSWVAALGDTLTPVEIEGRPALARTQDLDDLATATPSGSLRLLPAFDQSVLGPGTGDTELIPADRRSEISRAAGWISPVVLVDGRVCGTWEAKDDTLTVTWWQERGPLPRESLAHEADRLGTILGRSFQVSTVTT